MAHPWTAFHARHPASLILQLYPRKSILCAPSRSLNAKHFVGKSAYIAETTRFLLAVMGFL